MSKFNVGDEVTVKATVTSTPLASCCGEEVTVTVAGGHFGPKEVEDVLTDSLTLVKKAVPPLPKPGTVFKYDSLSGVYVVLADGRTTYIQRSYDGEFKTSPGIYPWDGFDHSRVKVIG